MIFLSPPHTPNHQVRDTMESIQRDFQTSQHRSKRTHSLNSPPTICLTVGPLPDKLRLALLPRSRPGVNKPRKSQCSLWHMNFQPQRFILPGLLSFSSIFIAKKSHLKTSPAKFHRINHLNKVALGSHLRHGVQKMK